MLVLVWILLASLFWGTVSLFLSLLLGDMELETAASFLSGLSYFLYVTTLMAFLAGAIGAAIEGFRRRRRYGR